MIKKIFIAALVNSMLVCCGGKDSKPFHQVEVNNPPVFNTNFIPFLLNNIID